MPLLRWDKVDRSGGLDACWPWMGARFKQGYGQQTIAGKKRRAHRLAYADAYGSVPAGTIVCHECDNRLCCNPLHLTAATYAYNARWLRGGPQRPPPWRRRSACKHGHSFDEANTRLYRGRRRCRTCDRLRKRA